LLIEQRTRHPELVEGSDMLSFLGRDGSPLPSEDAKGLASLP